MESNIYMFDLKIIKFNDYIEVTSCSEYNRKGDKPWTRYLRLNKDE